MRLVDEAEEVLILDSEQAARAATIAVMVGEVDHRRLVLLELSGGCTSSRDGADGNDDQPRPTLRVGQ